MPSWHVQGQLYLYPGLIEKMVSYISKYFTVMDKGKASESA
jgi:hypothetical protein